MTSSNMDPVFFFQDIFLFKTYNGTNRKTAVPQYMFGQIPSSQDTSTSMQCLASTLNAEKYASNCVGKEAVSILEFLIKNRIGKMTTDAIPPAIKDAPANLRKAFFFLCSIKHRAKKYNTKKMQIMKAI